MHCAFTVIGPREGKDTGELSIILLEDKEIRVFESVENTMILVLWLTYLYMLHLSQSLWNWH